MSGAQGLNVAGLSAALGRRPRPVGSDVFCGSMAHAIIGGLFVATLLTWIMRESWRM
jgi:hypothetical protein